MDNENSIDENYTELKKCLACGKQYRTMKEFINHAKDPWHAELIISSYSNYIDERETSIIMLLYSFFFSVFRIIFEAICFGGQCYKFLDNHTPQLVLKLSGDFIISFYRYV